MGRLAFCLDFKLSLNEGRAAYEIFTKTYLEDLLLAGREGGTGGGGYWLHSPRALARRYDHFPTQSGRAAVRNVRTRAAQDSVLTTWTGLRVETHVAPEEHPPPSPSFPIRSSGCSFTLYPLSSSLSSSRRCGEVLTQQFPTAAALFSMPRPPPPPPPKG